MDRTGEEKEQERGMNEKKEGNIPKAVQIGHFFNSPSATAA